MKNKLRKLIPQKAINYTKHLPTSIIANFKNGFPSKKMIVIGVTGTDGKTTTVNMIYSILKKAGKNVSMISTVNAKIGDKEYDTGFHVTSPSASQLQHFIKLAKKEQTEYLVLEVTSHGLDQFRFLGINFYIGVITNITHEHLDYHKTWENYFKTKAKLIKNTKIAILNHDEKHFSRLSKLTKGKVMSFGLGKGADFNPLKFPLKLKIPGEFNILNALAAAAVGVNLGLETKQIKSALEDFSSVPGRLEEVESNKEIRIYVDFAHTPNGLENALKTLKKQAKGHKLISVFGAASERDVQKRPLMGQISGQVADITILTDEDPRFEDSMKIINEIAAGVYKNGGVEGKNLFKEPDRKKAIQLALSLAEKGDVVGIFGKGHEKSMNYKGVEKPWSDKEVVETLLKTKN